MEGGREVERHNIQMTREMKQKRGGMNQCESLGSVDLVFMRTGLLS